MLWLFDSNSDHWFFHVHQGYGFITDSNGSDDLFVHHSAISGDGFKTLAEGEAVEFEVVTDSSGRRKAVNVTGPNGGPVKGDQQRASGQRGGRGGGFGGGECSQCMLPLPLVLSFQSLNSSNASLLLLL